MDPHNRHGHLPGDDREQGEQPSFLGRRQLATVDDVDPDLMTVTMTLHGAPLEVDTDGQVAYLRRWDHTPSDLELSGNGAIRVSVQDIGQWIRLEKGIEVRFTEGQVARVGDYWTIPARTATGSVLWPSGVARPPQGMGRYFAPIAVVDGDGAITSVQRRFTPLTRMLQP